MTYYYYYYHHYYYDLFSGYCIHSGSLFIYIFVSIFKSKGGKGKGGRGGGGGRMVKNGKQPLCLGYFLCLA